MANVLDDVLIDEEQRKKDALDLVVKTMDGASPADPLRDAFNNGMPLAQVKDPIDLPKMPELPAGQPSGFMAGLRDAFSISKLNEAQDRIGQRNLEEAAARGERVINLDNVGYNVTKFIEDNFGGTGMYKGQEYRPVLSGTEPTAKSPAPVGAPPDGALPPSPQPQLQPQTAITPQPTQPSIGPGSSNSFREFVKGGGNPADYVNPNRPIDRPGDLAAAVDRALADQRDKIANGLSGSLGMNAGDAAARQSLLDSIEFGRKNINPETGRPFIDDAGALAALSAADKTNRLQRLSTGRDIGDAISGALGQETRTPIDKNGNGGDRFRVTQAIQGSIPDWLGQIAKGQTMAVGAENVRQERIATGSAQTEAASKALDLKQAQDAQTGDIRAQNIVDAQGNIIGYRAGGKDRYLSATELEEMRYWTGTPTAGSGVYQPAIAKAPAAAPAVVEKPPVDGARKAPDGNWYVQQNGQYFKVK